MTLISLLWHNMLIVVANVVFMQSKDNYDVYYKSGMAKTSEFRAVKGKSKML